MSFLRRAYPLTLTAVFRRAAMPCVYIFNCSNHPCYAGVQTGVPITVVTFHTMHFWLIALAGVSQFLAGTLAQRTDFQLFILTYSIYSIAAAGLIFYQKLDTRHLHMLLAVGLGLRLLLWWGFPQFSDDFVRYLWDGNLVTQGIHPLAYTPTQVVQNQILTNDLTRQLFPHLNSPNYFSVYPTVLQGMFALAVKCGGGDVFRGVLVMKWMILLAELGILWLLINISENRLTTAVYALHPLPIFEHVGNVHFEGWMILSVLASLYFLQKNLWRAAAAALAAAVAIKLLPLIFLPAMFFYLDNKFRIKFLAFFLLMLALFIIPIWQTEVMRNMASSVQLYFSCFEFNASHYYLWKQALLPMFGVRAGQVAATMLALGTGVFILVWSYFQVEKGHFHSLTTAMTLSVCLYFLNASTVHPWYLTLPLVLGLLSGNWFAVIWALVVVLSYSHYDGGLFQERAEWLWVEYGIVLALFVVERWLRPVFTGSGEANKQA